MRNIYNIIHEILDDSLKIKLMKKLKKDNDPLNIYLYIDSIINEIIDKKYNKITNEILILIDNKCTIKKFRGGYSLPHPNIYNNNENYVSNPSFGSTNLDFKLGLTRTTIGGNSLPHPNIYNNNENYVSNPSFGSTNVDFNLGLTRTSIGGFSKITILNEIKKYLKSKKIIKKKISNLITERIINGIKLMNKNNKLSKFKNKLIIKMI